MLQVEKIQNALLHLIGFKRTTTSIEDAAISDMLTESESGLYFQQAHPLITIDSLYSIAPDFSNAANTAMFNGYSSAKRNTVYQKGTVIVSAGRLFKARHTIGPKVKIMPLNEPEDWSETYLFSEWLEDKVKSSIAKVVNRFVTEKYANAISKPILESRPLFDGAGRLVDTIENRHKLVGFEIVPIRAKGIVTKINKIGLQFTKPGKYKLYLMHSSSDEPIKTIDLQKRQTGFEWIPVEDFMLPYSSEFTDAGGSWYLVYKQDELPEGSQAINKDRDWSKGPCKSCSRNEYIAWQAWSKYIEIHPFSVGADSVNTLWDVETNDYNYNTNWGINLDISIYCDLTDFIIQERHTFTDLIMKQFAVDMLREFAFNPSVRTNRHSINASRMDILYELDGDSSSMKKSGLSYQLDQAFKAANISTQGLDRVCLPCKNNGIKYRTV